MKKGIYLTIITIITVICIIGGSLYHLVNFLSFLPFHTTTSSSSTKEVASSASEPLDAFQNIVADTDVALYLLNPYTNIVKIIQTGK